jgi:hypothetical protein
MGANRSSFILAHAIISLRSQISSIPKSGRSPVVLFYGGSPVFRGAAVEGVGWLAQLNGSQRADVRSAAHYGLPTKSGHSL